MQAENLDIHFDTDKSACRPLSAKLPTGGTRLTSTAGNNVTAAVSPAARLERAEIGTVSMPLELSPTTPTIKDVPVTSETVFGAHAPKDALLEVPAGKVRRLLVELEGVDYKTVPAVSYQVYVNLPDGTAPTTESPNYVGSLGLFGIKHAEGHHNGGHNQVFDVTDIIKNQSAAEKSLKVTIVPVPLLVRSPSASGTLSEVPIRDAHVTVRGIHIVAIQVDATTTE